MHPDQRGRGGCASRLLERSSWRACPRAADWPLTRARPQARRCGYRGRALLVAIAVLAVAAAPSGLASSPRLGSELSGERLEQELLSDRLCIDVHVERLNCRADAPPADTSTTTTTRPPPPDGRDSRAAHRSLLLLNDERRRHGLAPLCWSSTISNRYAWPHSEDMERQGRYFHNRRYISSATRAELDAHALGENVAQNVTADDAHRRLMASEGHRANILDRRFNEVGVAVVGDGERFIYITQDFAAVRNRGPGGC